ncbi:phosphomevalonate kinase [Streptomyces phytophilus]|uniref:phosphomevalonate kinase n=1 Tax=Streptomyces phytophilus TaxID=722715 RepID=UPI0015F09971|nr:phosphomevalonate kinase [Streptomyces phytophilus]
MTRGSSVVRRAPGKLFVAGEYAVVEPGVPAILVAVDRRITLTVSALDGTGVEISSDLAPGPLRWRWADGRLEPDTTHHHSHSSDGSSSTPGNGSSGSTAGSGDGGGGQAHRALGHVVSAVETTAGLLGEHGLAVPAMSVRVDSNLHDNGRKYGLGSSGAVTVAAVAAVAAFCGLDLPTGDRFRLAMLATARIDPKGSGGDLAASTWGGWIAYQAPDRDFVVDLARRRGTAEALRTPWPHFAVRRLPPPAGLDFQVGWTGNPASTASLVASLHRRTWRHSASHRAFVATSTGIVHALADALEHGDGPGLLHQIRRARTELARLDDEVHLGIFTTELTALCDAAEAVGGAAKPSGAGGGDCGIALLPAHAPRDLSRLRQRWAAAGILPLPLGPATERNEE